MVISSPCIKVFAIWSIMIEAPPLPVTPIVEGFSILNFNVDTTHDLE